MEQEEDRSVFRARFPVEDPQPFRFDRPVMDGPLSDLRVHGDLVDGGRGAPPRKVTVRAAPGAISSVVAGPAVVVGVAAFLGAVALLATSLAARRAGVLALASLNAPVRATAVAPRALRR